MPPEPKAQEKGDIRAFSYFKWRKPIDFEVKTFAGRHYNNYFLGMKYPFYKDKLALEIQSNIQTGKKGSSTITTSKSDYFMMAYADTDENPTAFQQYWIWKTNELAAFIEDNKNEKISNSEWLLSGKAKTDNLYNTMNLLIPESDVSRFIVKNPFEEWV